MMQSVVFVNSNPLFLQNIVDSVRSMLVDDDVGEDMINNNIIEKRVKLLLKILSTSDDHKATTSTEAVLSSPTNLHIQIDSMALNSLITRSDSDLNGLK
jgi:hypothetical protein